MPSRRATATTGGARLGLRIGAARLAQNGDKPTITDTQKLLWDLAMRLESGASSDAERALEQARQELRDAMQRQAGDEEIERLIQQLYSAMDRWQKEHGREDEGSGRTPPHDGAGGEDGSQQRHHRRRSAEDARQDSRDGEERPARGSQAPARRAAQDDGKRHADDGRPQPAAAAGPARPAGTRQTSRAAR